MKNWDITQKQENKAVTVFVFVYSIEAAFR